jgi:hypothetical protein
MADQADLDEYFFKSCIVSEITSSSFTHVFVHPLGESSFSCRIYHHIFRFYPLFVVCDGTYLVDFTQFSGIPAHAV